MRRLLAPFVLVLATAWPIPPAAADPITVNDTLVFVNRTGTGGGEYGVVDDDPLAGTSFDSFISFCVERHEKLTFVDVFRVAAIGPTDSDGQALTTGTAWLYREFLAPGYGELGTAVLPYDGSDAAATGLQRVMWYFQGQEVLATVIGDPHAAAYYALVSGAVGVGNVLLAYGGSDVQIMQVVHNDPPGQVPSPAQDQLVYRRVPEPAVLLMMGLGFTALAARLRYRGRRQR